MTLYKVLRTCKDKNDDKKTLRVGDIVSCDNKRGKSGVDKGYFKPLKVIELQEETDKLTLDEIKDETVDVGSITKKEIKELLDKEGIEYKSSSTKDELLDLLPF